MAAFSYLAADSTGRERKGVIEADSLRQVREKLRAMDLLPIEVNPVREKRNKVKKEDQKTHFSARLKRKKVKMSDLALLTRQFASLLSAGLPVEEAIRGVAEQTEKSEIKGILIGVRSQVLEGRTLADAMDDFPGVFPTLYRATVRAGEKSGELGNVLSRVADYVEKQHRIQQKIKQALVYPTLLVTVSISILVFLLIYIVPKIVDVFSESNQSLPTVTLILLAVSHFIKTYGLYILISLVMVVFIFRRLLTLERFRYHVHQFLVRLPVIGKLLKAINSARFSRTFGILFAASVPVLNAMMAANEVVSILPMKNAIDDAIGTVGEGVDIHLALRETGYFMPMNIHLIAIGESTGQLEDMLERAADQQDQDVTMFIENALTLFEPLMILLMGGMVLFIVLAVLLPIFNLDVLVQ